MRGAGEVEVLNITAIFKHKTTDERYYLAPSFALSMYSWSLREN